MLWTDGGWCDAAGGSSRRFLAVGWGDGTRFGEGGVQTRCCAAFCADTGGWEGRMTGEGGRGTGDEGLGTRDGGAWTPCARWCCAFVVIVFPTFSRDCVRLEGEDAREGWCRCKGCTQCTVYSGNPYKIKWYNLADCLKAG